MVMRNWSARFAPCADMMAANTPSDDDPLKWNRVSSRHARQQSPNYGYAPLKPGYTPPARLCVGVLPQESAVRNRRKHLLAEPTTTEQSQAGAGPAPTRSGIGSRLDDGIVRVATLPVPRRVGVRGIGIPTER